MYVGMYENVTPLYFEVCKIYYSVLCAYVCGYIFEISVLRILWTTPFVPYENQRGVNEGSIEKYSLVVELGPFVYKFKQFFFEKYRSHVK